MPRRDLTVDVPGPFGTAAVEMARAGLAVIPCAGDDGKVPAIRWARLKRPLGQAALEKMMTGHAGENVGVLTGLSRITVVDIDDRGQVETMVSRCGSTPLIVETPSGGIHLWYRHAGEMSANMRGDGLAVDVKAIGGFVVTPPSVRPSGPHAGKLYRFLSGSWSDLEHLPWATPGSLRMAMDHGNRQSARHPGRVTKGSRNPTLLRALLHHARGVDDFDALLDVAHGINAGFIPPEEAAKVEATARKAWEYQITGRNWVGREAFFMTTMSEAAVLLENPDALALRTRLMISHNGSEQPFAISPAAMKRDDVMRGWSKGRYIETRNWLEARGFIAMLHRGGSRPGDPSQFVFTVPDLAMGRATLPNTNEHPRSSPSRPESLSLPDRLPERNRRSA